MSHDHNEEHEHEEHPSHLKLMAGILGGLLVLTIVTVLASYVDFGSTTINITIAMLIATVKAGLVAVYFMHLRWESKLIQSFALISLPLLVLLIGFDLWDVGLRMLSKLYVF